MNVMNVVNSRMPLPLYLFAIAVLDCVRSYDTLSIRRRFWPRVSVVPALDVCCARRRLFFFYLALIIASFRFLQRGYSSIWAPRISGSESLSDSCRPDEANS
jgi:hypothetical protein